MQALHRLLAATTILWTLAAAGADPYPSKPIRLVVPFAAGGTADIAARIVAGPLSRALGQPVVVENRGGADGAIAADAVMKAAPDGYTLLFATSSPLSAVPALRKEPPYDPLRDFTPIGLTNNFGFFLVVHDSVPAQTAAQLLDYARANPGKLNYGTGNTTAILATAQLKHHYGLNLVHIPYKGDAPAVNDLAAGRVEMMFVTGTALAFVKEGRLRALAAMLPSRSPLLPDVPTMQEAGLSSVSITPWGGLVGPAKLPPEIVNRIARELKPILASAQVRDDLARLALEARSSTPEEMAAVIREQLEIYRRTVDEVGIQRD